MNKSLSILSAALAVLSAGLLAPAPAAAQAVFSAAAQGSTCDPQKTNSSGAYTSTSATAFGSVTCSSSGVTVGLTAWGFTAATTPPASATTGFTQGNLGDFNSLGFGAYTGTNESSTTSNHAFDNQATGCGSGTSAVNYSGGTTAGGGTAAVAVSAGNTGCGGAIEGLLMNFGAAKVALSSVSIGYTGGDADLSVYVWTGGAGGPTMGSQTLANNASSGLAGWTLVGSNNMAVGTAFGTGDTVYSSYFLVTTYFGATTASLNYGNDAFKINGWAVNSCSGTVNSSGVCTTGSGVPEPASLALVGVALLGASVTRRRRFFRG